MYFSPNLSCGYTRRVGGYPGWVRIAGSWLSISTFGRALVSLTLPVQRFSFVHQVKWGVEGDTRRPLWKRHCSQQTCSCLIDGMGLKCAFIPPDFSMKALIILCKRGKITSNQSMQALVTARDANGTVTRETMEKLMSEVK